METTWNKKEFKAYLLLYCATIDHEENQKELKMIKSQITEDAYIKIHEEFEEDNDYQSIEKINHTVERLGYTKENIDYLITQIKALFMVDGEFDATEQALFIGLKRILK